MEPITSKFIFHCVQLIIYFAIFVCGFIVSIVISYAKVAIGRCPLYLKFTSTASRSFQPNFAGESSCLFILYYPILSSIAFPAIVMFFYGIVVYQLYKGNERPANRLPLTFLISVVSLWLFLMLIMACVASSGRATMCASYLKGNDRAESCYELDDIGWGPKFESPYFVGRIILIEVVAWLTLLLWIIQDALLIYLYKQRTRGGAAVAVPQDEL